MNIVTRLAASHTAPELHPHRYHLSMFPRQGSASSAMLLLVLLGSALLQSRACSFEAGDKVFDLSALHNPAGYTMMSNGYQYRFDICNSCDEKCRVGAFGSCQTKVQTSCQDVILNTLYSTCCLSKMQPPKRPPNALLPSQAPGYQYSWASHCKTMGNVNDVIVRSKGQDWVPGARLMARDFLKRFSSDNWLPLTRAFHRRALHYRPMRRLHRRGAVQVSPSRAPSQNQSASTVFFRIHPPAAPRARALCSLRSRARRTPIRRPQSWRRVWEPASESPPRHVPHATL